MINLKEETLKIIEWIKEYVENSNSKGVVIGVSGGKDSGVVAALAVKALRKRKCTCSTYAMLFKEGRQRRC